jgi:hypothetical protein
MESETSKQQCEDEWTAVPKYPSYERKQWKQKSASYLNEEVGILAFLRHINGLGCAYAKCGQLVRSM